MAGVACGIAAEILFFVGVSINLVGEKKIVADSPKHAQKKI